jgi:hypothetical protein
MEECLLHIILVRLQNHTKISSTFKRHELCLDVSSLKMIMYDFITLKMNLTLSTGDAHSVSPLK